MVDDGRIRGLTKLLVVFKAGAVPGGPDHLSLSSWALKALCPSQSLGLSSSFLSDQ